MLEAAAIEAVRAAQAPQSVAYLNELLSANKAADVDAGGFVPVVVLTHPAAAKAVDAALEEISKSGATGGAHVRLRML